MTVLPFATEVTRLVETQVTPTVSVSRNTDWGPQLESSTDSDSMDTVPARRKFQAEKRVPGCSR